MALLPCRTRRRRTFKRRYELCERHTLTQTNAVFEFHVKNNSGKELVETIDLKKEANVYEGKAKGRRICGMSFTKMIRSPTLPAARSTARRHSWAASLR